jgi:diaminohydroxyphosphoribosylaminopyrimidine deaminase/5-amino-6-(5-phosphoribosylamino)uracil reductase
VGCVLTRGDQILGEGAHRYDLRDHAEIVALKDAAAHGNSVRGATAYVSLEPCSHHGRTPPCADALVSAGIARCVVATVDPNPLVRKAGVARLRSAGIEVSVADPRSAIAQEARRLNDAFAFSIQHERPFIHLKAAVSADGKLAPSPESHTSKSPYWITGPAARADVQLLRHHADVLLTGIGTVLADDPELTDRTGLPRRRPLLRVILDSGLRTPLDSRLVQSAGSDLLLIASAAASREQVSAFQERGIEVIRLLDNSAARSLLVLFAAVLHQRGVRSVLVEAGSRLNATLLAESYVDRVTFYTGPLKLGADALPFALGQPGPATWEARLTGVLRGSFPHGPGEDLCASGYLHDPWEGVDAPPAPVIVMPSCPEPSS